jgi:hypothetical protein
VAARSAGGHEHLPARIPSPDTVVEENGVYETVVRESHMVPSAFDIIRFRLHAQYRCPSSFPTYEQSRVQQKVAEKNNRTCPKRITPPSGTRAAVAAFGSLQSAVPIGIRSRPRKIGAVLISDGPANTHIIRICPPVLPWIQRAWMPASSNDHPKCQGRLRVLPFKPPHALTTTLVYPGNQT